MKDIKQVVFYMKEQINKQADAEVNRIMNEISEIKEKEEEKVIAEAKKEADLHLNAALKKLNSDKSLAISKYNSQKTKTLIERRESYTEELFEEAKKKLIAFTEGTQYADFMKKKMNQYNFDEKVLVYVNERDMKFEKEFKNRFDCDLKITNIEIGGFKIETQNQVVFDESLDSALRDQRSWFEDHSMMTLQ